jgi:DtxR family transcriptional regulator, Mn-dependent transcriptional regulator
MLSFAEENYLKTIFHLSHQGMVEVTTNAIADNLSTKPASVSDMLKKLAAKELINYVKYQGVSLSPKGKTLALQIVRKHRLWEVFLFKKLNFSWDEVHEIAEQLEHIKSTTLIERLDAFLGYPEFDPHGDPIPDENGNIKSRPKQPLLDLLLNQQGVVVGVRETSALFLQYLDKLGIQIGGKIKVLDRVAFDGSMEILLDNKKTILLSRNAAENIYISADRLNEKNS